MKSFTSRFRGFLCAALLLIVGTMSATTLFAATSDGELYQVVVSSTLTVRNAPSLSGTVIGHLGNGVIVKVYSKERNWAKIDFNGGYGFVSGTYLVKTSVSTESDSEQGNRAIFRFMKRSISDWFLYAAIAFAVLTYFIYTEDEGFVALMVSFLLMTVCQLIYISGYFGEQAIPPFCSPGDVGWLWAIVGFVGMLVFLGFQIFILLTMTDWISDETDCFIELRVGIWGWVIGFAYLMINGLFFDFRNVRYPIWTMIGFQALQVILSFRGNLRYFPLVVCFNIVYLLAVFAITLASINLVSILIVIGIIYFFFHSVFSESPRCCGWCRSYSNGYCYYRNRSVSQHSICNKFER